MAKDYSDWRDGYASEDSLGMCGTPTASRDQIVHLMHEARTARDWAQVELCELALSGDAQAWGKCERAIRDARAQDDSE